MDREYFIEKVEEIRSASIDILIERNLGKNGYAKDSEDAVHNFTVGANMLAKENGTPAQVAWEYMVKHLVALRDKVVNSDFSRPEDTKENCRDIINYTSIIYAISCFMNDIEKKKECKQNDQV